MTLWDVVPAPPLPAVTPMTPAAVLGAVVGAAVAPSRTTSSPVVAFFFFFVVLFESTCAGGAEPRQILLVCGRAETATAAQHAAGAGQHRGVQGHRQESSSTVKFAIVCHVCMPRARTVYTKRCSFVPTT